MKKGLLLSVVASTMIFAGGDIAPVEPAAPAPAADCSEFYGSVGAYYRTISADAGDLFATDVAGNANAFSLTAVVGVEKELFGGLSFGVEAAGWSNAGMFDAADVAPIRARVSAGSLEGGILSQAYVAASFNNTAVKMGRFALPKSLSPWAWSDRTAGVLDNTFEGVLVANTDVTDTTLYAVAVKKVMPSNGVRANIGNDSMLIAGGFVNTSLTDTTISGVGYYIPEIIAPTVVIPDTAAYAAFLTVDTAINGAKVSAQAAFVGGDDMGVALDDPTVVAGVKVAYDFGMFDASLAASYVNDGEFPLGLAGNFWLYTANEVESTLFAGAATTAVLAKVSTKVGIGTLCGSYGYWDADNTTGAGADSAAGMRVGYKFKVAGIDTSINYRSLVVTQLAGAADVERHQVRVEASYKF